MLLSFACSRVFNHWLVRSTCVPCIYNLSVPACCGSVLRETGACQLSASIFSSSQLLRCTLPEQGVHTQRSPFSPTEGKGLSRAVEGLVFSCLRRAPSSLPTDLYFPLPLWLNFYLTFLSSLIPARIRIFAEFCLLGWCYQLGCLLLPNSFCSNPEQKEILLEGCWVLQQSVRNCRKSLAKWPEAGQ